MTFDMAKLSRPKFLQRMIDEAHTEPETEDAAWWAAASFDAPAHLRASRQRIFHGKTIGTPRPSVELGARCMELSEHLNRELHHDGCWIVMLVNRDADMPPHDQYSTYRHCRVLWADPDGDVQFVVHLDGFTDDRAMRQSVDVYTDACEEAWHRADTAINGWLDVQPDQLIRE